jgi:hypothetical protein
MAFPPSRLAPIPTVRKESPTMTGFLRHCLPVLLVLAVLAFIAAPSPACPFCSMQGQTLTGEVAQASMVLYGTLANAKEEGEGSTDLVIDSVVKENDILGKSKTVTIPRYVPQPTDGKYKYLVFCDVFKGKIDFYRGMAVKADSDLPKYLRGALAVKDKKPNDRLRYFFDYLDNSDVEISNDAYKEFGNADYKDYRDMAASLPAERIAGWLKSKATPSFRYGLYASMLGHCGKPEDSKVLLALLEDPEKPATSGIDGILAGYVMLKPKEGWQYVRGILADPKKDFMLRYAALRAAQFFHDSRPDVVKHEEIVAAIELLLSQKDIADLAVEDLRKWREWNLADKVLGLSKTPAFEIPIVRRSVLRFALSCADKVATAKVYVGEERTKDAQMVSDAEELLKLEETPATPTTPPVINAGR